MRINLYIFLFNFSLFVFINIGFSKNISVRILSNAQSFKIFLRNSQKVTLYNKNKKIKTYLLKRPVIINTTQDSKISFFNDKYSLPITLSSNGDFIINGKTYKGKIRVVSSGSNKVKLINYLDIESYLYGVLPYEVDDTWTDQMLRLQTIVSRTYALAFLGRHKKQGFDYCDTAHCQVYRGIDIENEKKIKDIVDSTEGIFICDDKNRPIKAFYHAVCGGQTENINEVWKDFNPVNYLRSIYCEYCKNTPYFYWSFEVDRNILRKRLNSYGVKISTITGIKPYPENEKRVSYLHFFDNNKDFFVKIGLLRKIFKNKIKSNYIIETKIIGQKVIFEGKGWGHGIGLCQWGANTMTTLNKNISEIIEYYYPGTHLFAKKNEK